jgi:hypothetical protein
VASNAQKGQYYKARTKKYYEKLGWDVGHMEVMKWIHSIDKATGQPVRIPVKRDQFGADLVMMNGESVWFVQVKSRSKDVSAGHREMSNFKYPPPRPCGCVRRVVVVWELRSREPQVFDFADYKPREMKPTAHPVEVEQPAPTVPELELTPPDEPSDRRRRSTIPRTTLF